jgi:hypothetical protein
MSKTSVENGDLLVSTEEFELYIYIDESSYENGKIPVPIANKPPTLFFEALKL